MLCPHCHVTIDPDMRFCPNCGYRLRPVPTSNYPQSSPQSPTQPQNFGQSYPQSNPPQNFTEQYPVFPTPVPEQKTDFGQYPDVPTYRNTSQQNYFDQEFSQPNENSYTYNPPNYNAEPPRQQNNPGRTYSPTSPGKNETTMHLEKDLDYNADFSGGQYTQRPPQPNYQDPMYQVPPSQFQSPPPSQPYPHQNSIENENIPQQNHPQSAPPLTTENPSNYREEEKKQYGVGTAKKGQHSILLPPEEEQEDYDDYDDDYDDDDYLYEKKKSKKGVIFLILILVIVGTLTILQLTGIVKMQEWPSAAMGIFSQDVASESISSEETVSSDAATDQTVPTPVDMNATVTGDAWTLTVTQAQVVSSVGTETAPDGYEYLQLEMTFTYNPDSADSVLRYSNYDYTLGSQSSSDGARLSAENFPEEEGALNLLTVNRGETVTGKVFFKIPSSSQETTGYILYFTPRNSSSPKAAFSISVLPATESLPVSEEAK